MDRLVQPSGLPDEIWHDELVFYRIENPKMRVPTEEEQEIERIAKGMPADSKWRRPLWLLFEDPGSSAFARWLSIWSIVVIIVGVMAFIAETHPTFRFNKERSWAGVKTYHVNAFFQIIETIVVVYFSLELVCRIIATTQKLLFFTHVTNCIDFLAIAPFYFDMMGLKGGQGTLVLRVVRLARVFRIVGLIFKLGKYSAGARVLASTVTTCMRELTILAVVFIMAVVLYASGIYFCENPDPELDLSDFNSIVVSMYWSVITVTTVGYGDMSPATSCGQFVSCFAALSGIFCLGLPISVITAKFTERYAEMVREWKIEEERLRLAKLDKQLAANRAMLGLTSKLQNIMEKESGGGLMGAFGRSFSTKNSVAPIKPTPEQIYQVAESVFNEVDVDGSGQIDVPELQVCMQKLGFEELSLDAISDMLEQIDLDSNGSIDVKEFAAFVSRTVMDDTLLRANNAKLMKQTQVRARNTAKRF